MLLVDGGPLTSQLPAVQHRDVYCTVADLLPQHNCSEHAAKTGSSCTGGSLDLFSSSTDTDSHCVAECQLLHLEKTSKSRPVAHEPHQPKLGHTSGLNTCSFSPAAAGSADFPSSRNPRPPSRPALQLWKGLSCFQQGWLQ